MCHPVVEAHKSAVLPDSEFFLERFPALKRWAAVTRPNGLECRAPDGIGNEKLVGRLAKRPSREAGPSCLSATLRVADAGETLRLRSGQAPAPHTERGSFDLAFDRLRTGRPRHIEEKPGLKPRLLFCVLFTGLKAGAPTDATLRVARTGRGRLCHTVTFNRPAGLGILFGT